MISIDQLAYFALSDVGLKRPRNEDAYAIYDSAATTAGNCRAYLFGVADGMGGHPCGDKASAMACSGLKVFFNDWNGGFNAAASADKLARLVFSIDAQIRDHAAVDADCEEMGTTLAALLITAEFGVMAHVGDSRIYHLRNGTLFPLTRDHTFVQEMIDERELSAEAALRHPLRNVLTQVLGTEEPLEKVDTDLITIARGDRFLLSSDGLHDLVPLQTIKKTLAGCDSPKKSAELLLKSALLNGGKDNVTAIVIHL